MDHVSLVAAPAAVHVLPSVSATSQIRTQMELLKNYSSPKLSRYRASRLICVLMFICNVYFRNVEKIINTWRDLLDEKELESSEDGYDSDPEEKECVEDIEYTDEEDYEEQAEGNTDGLEWDMEYE